jgi:hypothetical protein
MNVYKHPSPRTANTGPGGQQVRSPGCGMSGQFRLDAASPPAWRPPGERGTRGATQRPAWRHQGECGASVAAGVAEPRASAPRAPPPRWPTSRCSVRPGTTIGEFRWVVVPSPIVPEVLSPHVATVPLASTAPRVGSPPVNARRGQCRRGRDSRRGEERRRQPRAAEHRNHARGRTPAPERLATRSEQLSAPRQPPRARHVRPEPSRILAQGAEAALKRDWNEGGAPAVRPFPPSGTIWSCGHDAVSRALIR